MNVELLRKVEEHIMAEPKRLYMRAYLKRKKNTPEIFSRYGDRHEYPACGTAACIAGWATILSGYDNPDSEYDIYRTAKTLLELTSAQADNLFEPSMWPEQFKGVALKDDGSPEAAAGTVARIEHFIKTEGRD